jgi:hypothetical protein
MTGGIVTTKTAFAAEFRMQWRRMALWVVVAALGGFTLFVAVVGNGPLDEASTLPIRRVAAEWALLLNVWLPVGVAGLLADRLPRDRSTGVDELLAATTTSLPARLLGKVLGATAATLMPVGTVYAVGTALLAADRGPGVMPVAGAALVVVALPGLLAVAALSVLLPAFTPATVYLLLFAAGWFWFSAAPGLPGSPAESAVDPGGWVAASALFDVPSELTAPAGPAQLAANLALMAALTALPLLAVPRVLAARAARA